MVRPHIAQVCNSHGFNHEWISSKYHHFVFREIVKQIEEKYTGNIIVIDHTWLKCISNITEFSRLYPNICMSNVDHVFFIALVDPIIWHGPYCDKIINFLNPKKVHYIPKKSSFCFWGYFAQNEFYDYKNLDLSWTGSKLFLSYNRKPHNHRVTLIRTLTDAKLLSSGIVTMGNDDPNKVLNIHQNLQFINKDVSGHLAVPNNIDSLGHSKVWQNCFINVVTETITYDHFFSEKIFKPIVGKRPFMLLGCPNSLTRLQDMGFKTFSNYWPESYNEVIDERYGPMNLLEEKSCTMIRDILSRLRALPISELKEMYKDMQHILEHNHKHFFGEFSKANESNLLNIIREEK